MKLIDIEEDKIYKSKYECVFYKYNERGEIERSLYADDWECSSVLVTNIPELLNTNVSEYTPTKWVIVNDVEGLRIRLRQTDSIVWLSLKELEKLYEDVANEKNAPF